MGEPAGIGGELTLLAWHRRVDSATPPFFVIDDPRRLADLAGQLGINVQGPTARRLVGLQRI